MISLVIVNYRSASLAIEAIRTARRSTGRPLEIIAVDNSESAEEAESLRPHVDRLLRPERNLGYGAAINLALAAVTGDIVIVSNPDVVFDLDAIELLCSEIESGAGVAGPGFFWDEGFEWRMPPADVHSSLEKLDAAVATRLEWWQRHRDCRRLVERIAFWRRTEPHDIATLSGAVLAFPAKLLQHEPFDERYFLYFEETDLLRRLRRRGHRIRHVPAARCRHLFNQSVGASALATEAYSRSEALYHEKWSSWAMRGLANAIATGPGITTVRTADHIDAPSHGMLAEISPLADFSTAAGAFVNAGRVTIPNDILDSLRQMQLFLRLVEPSNLRISDAILWRKESAASRPQAFDLDSSR